MIHLYQRNILKLSNLTKIEIYYLIKLAQHLKIQKKNNIEKQYLKKKCIALIFDKASTRTRCSFEIAAYDQGAKTTYLGPGDTHLGNKESIEDTAKFIGLVYDGIQYRGHNHNNIKMLAKYSGVPVWNGLTQKYHPTQLLADLLTIIEFNPNQYDLSQITISYIGDATNNIASTIIEAATLIGFNLRIIAPKQYWPNKTFFNHHQNKIKKFNKLILCTDDIKNGVHKTDYIYTDVWISMGELSNTFEKKISLLKPYQVNQEIIEATKNPNVKVLHCLPSLHDNKTEIGHTISKKYGLNNGIEITNDVFKSNEKYIFQQSENRLHTIKSILVSTLYKPEIYF
ncbi:MAG: ornithine carbamoyltransferase [Buchnera aphidicola (Eriosoma harunire)]